MHPDEVEIIMNECCDPEDEDGCIPYESKQMARVNESYTYDLADLLTPGL